MGRRSRKMVGQTYGSAALRRSRTVVLPNRQLRLVVLACESSWADRLYEYRGHGVYKDWSNISVSIGLDGVSYYRRMLPLTTLLSDCHIAINAHIIYCQSPVIGR